MAFTKTHKMGMKSPHVKEFHKYMAKKHGETLKQYYKRPMKSAALKSKMSKEGASGMGSKKE